MKFLAVEPIPKLIASGMGEFILRSGRCMFCGLCAQVCPVDAITMSKDYELSVQDRDGLVYTKTELATIGGQIPSWWDDVIEPPVNAAAR